MGVWLSYWTGNMASFIPRQDPERWRVGFTGTGVVFSPPASIARSASLPAWGRGAPRVTAHAASLRHPHQADSRPGRFLLAGRAAVLMTPQAGDTTTTQLPVAQGQAVTGQGTWPFARRREGPLAQPTDPGTPTRAWISRCRPGHSAPLSVSLPLCKMGPLTHSAWEGPGKEGTSRHEGGYQTAPPGSPKPRAPLQDPQGGSRVGLESRPSVTRPARLFTKLEHINEEQVRLSSQNGP